MASTFPCNSVFVAEAAPHLHGAKVKSDGLQIAWTLEDALHLVFSSKHLDRLLLDHQSQTVTLLRKVLLHHSGIVIGPHMCAA
jgi:hypothetical protein